MNVSIPAVASASKSTSSVTVKDAVFSIAS